MAKQLRACLQSSEQKSQESQIDELQTGIDFALTVFPGLSTLFQPGKRTLNDPTFGNDLEARAFIF
jgi:hypothetical protein